MLRGFATLNFYAADFEAAKNWYAELLGIEPYYQVPGAYAEFRLGDYQHELGLINSRFAPGGATSGPAGSIMYWHVDDLQAAFDRLLSMGAQEYQPITEQGEGKGFITASVVDPFGNILGIMRNPHYLEVLTRTRPV
ncbi:VOC family protein [Nonomuraea turkmeniaca]|uniref:VOC family protein n=1 Tax=Nonomuraea turkmeniaca TaxID=103838 RepID=A0A5S4FL74_9ACTN|nr:VOC family protein [Nonomuraea turkmeniaca]TMR21422.1 VOC family protein [Nonomuraea turkmeniaca]